MKIRDLLCFFGLHRWEETGYEIDYALFQWREHVCSNCTEKKYTSGMMTLPKECHPIPGSSFDVARRRRVE